jgi:hypothetical protein
LEDIEIIASRPGQLSLAIIRVKDNEVLARQVEERFGAINGIHQVEADAVQGLVSIDYDRQRLSSLSFLLQLKETFAALFPEVSASQLLQSVGIAACGLMPQPPRCRLARFLGHPRPTQVRSRHH